MSNATGLRVYFRSNLGGTLSWPSGGGGLGGLTRSDEGGLEEFEESLRAAASCWLSRATTSLRAASSASRASTRACSRRQLGQRAVSLALMAINHTDSASGALHSTGERPPFYNMGSTRMPAPGPKSGKKSSIW